VDDNALKSSGVYSMNGFTKMIPALFTSASTDPNRFTAVPTIISAVEARTNVAVHQREIFRALQLVPMGDLAQGTNHVVAAIEEQVRTASVIV
jgi:hypothetical protein